MAKPKKVKTTASSKRKRGGRKVVRDSTDAA